MICSAHARDIIFVISSQTPSAAVMESNLEIPAPEKSNPLVRLQYSEIKFSCETKIIGSKISDCDNFLQLS